MTNRTSTVTLSVADKFTQPLQAYAQGTEKAVQATEKLAAVGKQGADAAAKLAKAQEEAAQANKKAGDAAAVYAKQQMAAFNEIQQAEKATREESERRRKAFLDGAAAIRDGLAITAAAAIGFGVAVNQAFEFGKAGGVVTQTTESFTRMVQITGGMPDTLNQLRAAARGTVDDLTLMANVQTLLAGTSGQLSNAFINAAPQLLEIAKAANKINPTLGDTNFLFESIARGIKRSSPLILDNLGIVVKLGPAYADFAESVGKTTEELTAEEKQIALLNAVLAQGDVLMQQAGGSADSAADSFARAEAAATNLGNAIKVKFAPPMGELATLFAQNAEYAVLLQKAVDRGAMSSTQAQIALAKYLFTVMDHTAALAELVAEEERYGQQLNAVDPFVQNMRLRTEETTTAIIHHSAALSSTAQYYADLVGGLETVEERMARQNDVYGDAEAALRRFNIGQTQQIELQERLMLLTGELTEEDLARRDAIGYLTKQLELGRISNDEYLAALERMASGAWTARDAINQIGAAINALPPSGTRWEYEVVTNHYNNTHDVNVSEPGPGVPVVVTTTPSTTPAPGGSGGSAPTFGGGGTGTASSKGTTGAGLNLNITIVQQAGESGEALAYRVADIIGQRADQLQRMGISA